ncbi:MAG TPA: helix-turn-helix transcriptional regulator [Streptosporangiaceae bacterium]|nr:helix-turn-helix transcriptional regulator [Streptosporangiaceae bacterium]
MGRPQKPLERDGSPVREFAFWLRDLRSSSGLRYQELARRTHYATSTLQGAAAGQRLPTLRVVRAFVEACGGDLEAWRAYWTQIRRILDRDAPPDLSRSVEPPWAQESSRAAPPAGEDRQGPGRRSASEPDRPVIEGPDGWYVESFTALLRLDAEPIEAEEQRVVVATVDGLSEIATSISVPRHPDDASQSHLLDAELLHGGSLELREQPYESYFRHVIVLPRPLKAGERHAYALRLRIPPGQPMAQHYVHVPFRRSDSFDLRVRFSPRRPPRAVWALTGVPTAVIYQRSPASTPLVPDRFGEIHVTFSSLSVGLGYGVCWQY